MTTPEIEWADPPRPSPRGAGRAAQIDAVVEQLKASPGRWALVDRAISHNSYTTWTKRGVQVRVVQVSVGPRRVDIYARWPKGGAA